LTALLLACGGGAGTTTEVLAPATPSLTSQPASQTTLLGQTATFAVAATGLAPFAYQWSRDGVPIPAATTPSYTTAAAAKTDDGATYSVLLTNRLGSVTSSPATLKVQWAPIITAQPADLVVTEGQLAAFTVVADANPVESYQWQKDGVDIPGATQASYQIAITALGDSGTTYRCLLSNAVSSTLSNAATLTVNPAQHPPVITGFTANPTTLTLGQSTTLSWVVTGASGLSIDQNVGVVTGLTSQSVTPSTIGSITYTLTATNSAGSTQASVPVVVNAVASYALTVSLGAGTTGTPAASANYLQGALVNYTYALQTGYQNLQVTLDGSPVPTSGTVLMNGVHTLATTAQPQTFTITASAGANGTISPIGTTTVPYGGNQTYTITPNAGYQVASVLVDGTSVGTFATYSFVNVTANRTISATFIPVPITLTINLGAGITGTPAITTVYAQGTVVNYSYALQPGYQNLVVTVDGNAVAAAGSLTMDGAHTLVATAQSPTITANAGPNGSISPSGVTTVAYGGNQTYTITPNTGYRVADVQVDGLSVGVPTTVPFSNVTANHTISATFTIQTFPITATSGLNGTITPAGVTTVNYGGNQTYAITADPSYQVATVTVDGVAAGAITSYTFTNVTTNHTIGATFTPQPTLTVTLGLGITGTPVMGTASYPQGTVVNYSYGLQPGYQSLHVSLDGNPVPFSGSITMNGSHTLVVSATVQTFTITASAGSNGTISPIGITTLNWGSTPTFTITPNTGYIVADVQVDGGSVGAVTTYTFPALTANRIIVATFTPIPDYIITVNLGVGATGSPATTMSYSVSLGTIHYAYVLSTGYQNLKVYLDGVQVPINGFVPIDGNHTLDVTAQPLTFTITASAGPNGTISPPGISTVNWGTSPTYAINPAPGYQVATLLVDGTSVGASTTYTFAPMSFNETIAATFSLLLSADMALPLSVHPGDTWMKASVPIQTGMTYAWSKVDGTSIGTITSGQTTGVIGFSAGTVGTFQLHSDVQNPASAHAAITRTVTVQNATWLVKNGGLSAALSGRASTVLPGGRALLVGGTGIANVPEAAAEMFDPAIGVWFPTTSLGTARSGTAATLLTDGTVLVSGGIGGAGDLPSAEIYTPSTGAWSSTGSLTTARSGHTSTLLANNKVLVVGGETNGNPSTPLASAELFNPTGGTWATTGSLTTARTGHTATLLSTGKVLVTGGRNGAGANASPELYDPAGTWSAAGAMVTGRSGHSALLLPNGKVLVVGGLDISNVPLATAELYDPATGLWAAANSLGTARSGSSITLLANGKVLVAGGTGVAGTLASSEIYDPTLGTWAVTGSLSTARSGHIAALLPNGTVLVAAGSAVDPLGSSETFDPATGTWTALGSLGTGRTTHSATLLANGPALTNGKTLVAGGLRGTTALASTLLYDATARTWTATGNLGTPRYGHTATLLGNGKVLVAGGQTAAAGFTTTTELYDPAAGTWTATGSLTTARANHTATLLQDGRVLVAGGSDASSHFSSAEIFDPGTGTWTPTGVLNAARAAHSATPLANGKVLVAGGQDGSGDLLSAELFDPSVGGGTWTFTTNSLGTARSGHSATLLQDGTVLVVGGSGFSGALLSVEIFNIAGETWSGTGGLATARFGHSATLLSNGKVLVVGGGNGTSSALRTVELYTPGTGTWTLTGSLNTARSGHTATFLNDGTVLTTFGAKGDVITEIYLP
jgi:hypothetical protein